MTSADDSAISQLAALQDLDRQRRERTELVRVLEAEIMELEAAQARQREANRTAQAEHNTVQARRRELEAHLQVEESKMTDRRMRLNRVRNEKELQAIRREIEVGKEANQLVEEELLGVFEAVDELGGKASTSEQALVEIDASATPKIAELRSRIAQLVAASASEQEQRDQMAAALDTNLRRKYEQIFERRGGTAVVEVRNGTCLGCHMNLPPQLFNELQRTREVRVCPNCHRILYWRPEPLESAAPSR